jgi:hypothetical protein
VPSLIARLISFRRPRGERRAEGWKARSVGSSFELTAADRRSLHLHQAIIEKLRRNPGLFELVRARIDQWSAQGRGRSDYPYRLEWQAAVLGGFERVVQVALDEGERGQVLRTCTPLTGILTEDERRAVMREAWRMTKRQAPASDF